MPVPPRVVFFVLPPAVTLSVAVFVPVDVGANCTLIVQLELPATELPQVLLCTNWLRFVPASAMLVMGKAALPPFVSVSESGALIAFFAVLPNANVVGNSVNDAAVPPLPLKVTVCVPAPPPALTLTLAVFEPPDVGVKVTLMVQAEPPGTEVPQVLVCENSARFVPASAMLEIRNAALPAFVTVTDCGTLVVFVGTVPKANAGGDTVKLGETAEPLSATIWVPVPPAPFTFSVAALVPLVEDLKTTLMVQLAPTGTEPAQVLVCEKDAAFAPLIVTLPICSAVAPMFVTVTDCGGLLVSVCQLPNANEVGCRV